MSRAAERTSFLAQTIEKDVRQFLFDEGYEGMPLEHISLHSEGTSFGVFVEGLDIIRVTVEVRGSSDEFYYLRSIQGEIAGTEDWAVQVQTSDPVSLGFIVEALLRAHLMGERR